MDSWVASQLHNKNKLSAWKKKKLNAINFQWNREGYYRSELWEKMYEELKAYKKEYGHCDVPQKDKNKKLASWVNGQRKKKLSADQKAKLDKLGFSWAGEIAEKKWNERVNEFIDLKKKNKLSILRAHMSLHSWIYQQKKNFHKLPDKKKKIVVTLKILGTLKGYN